MSELIHQNKYKSTNKS